jgi:hypothetical protein
MTWQPSESGNPAGRPKRVKPWRDAIERAIKRREEADPQALERLAARLLRKVDEGDIAAIKEFGDRIDGKVPQAIGGDPDNPVKAELEVSWKSYDDPS